MAPGFTIVSLFRKKRYRPVARLAAWLLARAKPRLRSLRTRTTPGKSAGMRSSESSVLALSTTIVWSCRSGSASRRLASRLRSMSRPFQLTMQTETSGRSDMGGRRDSLGGEEELSHRDTEAQRSGRLLLTLLLIHPLKSLSDEL